MEELCQTVRDIVRMNFLDLSMLSEVMKLIISVIVLFTALFCVGVMLWDYKESRALKLAKQAELSRVKRLSEAGTPEFYLKEFFLPFTRVLERKNAQDVIEDTSNVFRQGGKIELELVRNYNAQVSSRVLYATFWFTYPEQDIHRQILYAGKYWYPDGLSISGNGTRTFTYTDDPNREGNDLFYFLNECEKSYSVRKKGLYVKAQEGYTSVN